MDKESACLLRSFSLTLFDAVLERWALNVNMSALSEEVNGVAFSPFHCPIFENEYA